MENKDQYLNWISVLVVIAVIAAGTTMGIYIANKIL